MDDATMGKHLGSITAFSEVGEPIEPGQEPFIGDGVRGCAFDTPAGIYIPLIAADQPGTGAVAKFLDGLPFGYRIVFPTVINAKLREMLRRRRFVDAIDEGHDVMERSAGA